MGSLLLCITCVSCVYVYIFSNLVEWCCAHDVSVNFGRPLLSRSLGQFGDSCKAGGKNIWSAENTTYHVIIYYDTTMPYWLFHIHFDAGC